MTSTPYTLISADCHAGASHDTYRGYLDAKYLDDFDAWRAQYKNPFRDLQGSDRDRNWNSERRNAELAADGIVGEVIFPNTVPPFFPDMALLARPPSPDDFELRLEQLAPLAAHAGPTPAEIAVALDEIPADSVSPAFTR